MIVDLFLVRTGGNPDNEYRLYEAVDNSDFGWDERGQNDRSDELYEYFNETESYRSVNGVSMWKVVTITSTD